MSFREYELAHAQMLHIPSLRVSKCFLKSFDDKAEASRETTIKSHRQSSEEINKGSSIYYIHNIFLKTNISYPLISTPTCALKGIRSISFPEDFSYGLMNDPYP